MTPSVLVDPANPFWPTFAASWDDLPRDIWMADGGTYRRRRYAAFHVGEGAYERLTHRPHYQDRDHNPLNGGVERWFAPMKEEQARSPLFRDLLQGTGALIERMAPRDSRQWAVEAHQFRIEACSGAPGLPTPEGMHRDGRDWVLILLVSASDFTGGHTRVEGRSRKLLLRHRASTPGPRHYQRLIARRDYRMPHMNHKSEPNGTPLDSFNSRTNLGKQVVSHNIILS